MCVYVCVCMCVCVCVYVCVCVCVCVCVHACVCNLKIAHLYHAISSPCTTFHNLEIGMQFLDSENANAQHNLEIPKLRGTHNLPIHRLL